MLKNAYSFLLLMLSSIWQIAKFAVKAQLCYALYNGLYFLSHRYLTRCCSSLSVSCKKKHLHCTKQLIKEIQNPSIVNNVCTIYHYAGTFKQRLLEHILAALNNSPEINDSLRSNQKTLNNIYNSSADSDTVHLSYNYKMSFQDFKTKSINLDLHRRYNIASTKNQKYKLWLLGLSLLTDEDLIPPEVTFTPIHQPHKYNNLPSYTFYGHLKLFSLLFDYTIHPIQTLLIWAQTVHDLPLVLPTFNKHNNAEQLETILKHLTSCFTTFIARAKAELFICKNQSCLQIVDTYYPAIKPKLEQYLVDRDDFPMTYDQKLYVYNHLKEQNQLPDRFTPLSETTIYSNIGLAFADRDCFVFKLLQLEKETHGYMFETEELSLIENVYNRICVDYYNRPNITLTPAQLYIKDCYLRYIQKKSYSGFEVCFHKDKMDALKKTYTDTLRHIAQDINKTTGLCIDVCNIISTYS